MAEHDLEALQAELEQARRRIDALEARLAADAARGQEHWLYAALDAANIGVWEWDITRDHVEWSDAVYRLFGATRETFACTRDAFMSFVHPDDRARVGQMIERAITTDQRDYYIEHRVIGLDGELRHVTSNGLVMVDASGQPCRLAGALFDTTERMREEQRRAAMQQALIDAQQKALRELGSPIIPLAEGTLVMPLIGTLDPQRAAQVLESLLVAVAARRTQAVILDVTGVPTMDAEVARALMQVAPAVRLLGAEVVLTGLRPALAQQLVALDVDTRQFTTSADLQSGLEEAARLRAQRRG